MMKMEVFFAVSQDEEKKTKFKRHLFGNIFPYIYQMPHIEKIEMTSFFDTPDELQLQFTQIPIHFQLVLYIEKDKVQASIGSNICEKFKESIGAILETTVAVEGDTKVFYQWDLDQLR